MGIIGDNDRKGLYGNRKRGSALLDFANPKGHLL